MVYNGWTKYPTWPVRLRQRYSALASHITLASFARLVLARDDTQADSRLANISTISPAETFDSRLGPQAATSMISLQ